MKMEKKSKFFGFLQDVRVLLGVGLLLLSSQAFAYTCSQADGATITMTGIPTTISIPRDKSYPNYLTGWIQQESSLGTRWYTCANTINWAVSSIWAPDVAPTGQSIDGFTIYPTTVPGLGYVVRTWMSFGMDFINGTNGCGTSGQAGPSNLDYWAGNHMWGGDGGLSGQANIWCNGNLTYGVGMGGSSAVAFVIYGPATGGTTSQRQVYRMQVYGHGDDHYGGGGYDRKYVMPAIKVNVLSCTTPDIVVPLGTHSPASMPSVGSRTPAVKFNLAVNNCPAGMASIAYGFNFTSGTGYTANQGLFGLVSGATARGVNVKLMNADSTQAVPLDTWHALSAYNSTTGGSYTVPLSAAYQRVGTVTAGSADAELVIVMAYQ